MNEPSELIFPYPARVLRVDTQTRGTDLLALAKQSRAFDDTIFEERTPFFWTAEISNSNVDAYFTRMLPSTLANFAADAKAGVSFLNSHRHEELPFGRSLDGQVQDNGGNQRVLADFFTISGLNLNGVTTDDFIAGVRSGIVADVSVGFHQGTMICDVCQRNFWDCPHIPGMTYETKSADNVIRQQLATFGIDNARLAEVSGVYDGATPDATILKAQRMADLGQLKPEAARTLEARYHRSLFTDKKNYRGIDIPKKEKNMELEQQMAQIRTIFGIEENVDVVGVAMTTNTELLKLRTSNDLATRDLETAQERIKTLEPQAADGVTYRNDLMAEALAEGVRALGEKFNATTYETVLRNSPLSVVKQMKADWAEIGNVRFPGGRQSVDQGEQAPGGEKKNERSTIVPAAAYKS